MTKQEFSLKILGCSYSLFRAVLAGKRNFSYKRALLVSQLLNTSCGIWQDEERAAERRIAWTKFAGKK